MPDVDGAGLAVSPQGGALYTATHGLGAYRLDLGQQSRTRRRGSPSGGPSGASAPRQHASRSGRMVLPVPRHRHESEESV